MFQNYGLIENKTVEYNIRVALHTTNIFKERLNGIFNKMRIYILSKFNKPYEQYVNFPNSSKLIEESLEMVGLSGYEKKKIYQLSGGEQQRIALAKIIVKHTELILADEPTGSLDLDSKILVMDILKKLNDDGKTILLVTHDKEVTKYASRIETL